MSTFQIEKFDDYTHQDPVIWWEGFTTQLRILFVAKHEYINALFLNSKGGCQTWLSHLASTHDVDVAYLKDKISWEKLTRLWKKRFIVDGAPALAINRLFGMTQGNTATRDWLTEWEKIAATSGLDLPFPHLRREFYNRSCVALSLALGDREQYATFVEIIDKAREIIKTNRVAAYEKSAWHPTYVEKVRTGPRPQQFAAVQTDNIMENPTATQASREGDHVAAVQLRSNNKPRGNGKAKTASPAGNGQPTPWVKFTLTESEYKYRGRYGCCYWCNSTKHKTSQCLDQGKEDVRPLSSPSTTDSAVSPSSTVGDSTSWSRLEELDSLTFADFQWMSLPRSGRLSKPHCNVLMAQLRDYLRTAVPTPLMDAGVEVVDLHAYIAKIDREFKTQRYDDIDAPLLYVRIQIGEATCRALIDCEASRNYMSQDFMVRVGLGPRVRRKSQPTQVTLADGHTHKSTDWCIDDAPVYFAPHASEAVSFDILDTKFDMILGMSWLRSEDHPVNFYRRIVYVRDQNGVLVPCMVAPPHSSISVHVVSAASIRASITRDDIEEMGELEYLGDYVTPQGIRPFADKIEALRLWPEPTNTTDVRSFMGLAGYYQRFITGYSRIAAPMTRLQSPKVPFVFDDDARRSFQALKTAMLMAPVLSIYDPTLPTRVTTDAFGYGIGAVLEQHDGDDWHPVEYFSHKVPPINSLDDARKKELLAFVMALKQWRHFLLGRRRFTWVTDNNPLTYYKTQDTVSSTIRRWMYFIDQFDFTPKHFPGLSNRAADALSRRRDLCAMTHHAFAFDEELQRHFIRGYESDPDFAMLYAQLSSDHLPASHYRIVDGYLLLHSRGKDLLCVPRDHCLRTRFLGEYHDSRLVGHFGVNHTIARFRQRFRWPDLITDVTRYCDSCEVCQRTKPRNRNPYGELRPMPILHEPGLSIAMDVTGPFLRDRLRHDGILTVVDRLKDIVSDRDTRFMSAFWTALMQESGTKMKPSSARHPQTNGQTERAHQTAQMMLRTLIHPDQKGWVDRLPDIELAYNTSVHPAIGVTPFELHHSGRKGRIFADLLLPRPADIDAACSPASVRKYRELPAQARSNMQKAQVRMQQQANRRHVPCPIHAGDLVWVSAKEFALEQDVSRKLLPKWFGRWPITSAAGDEPNGPSFVINIPAHLTVHPVYHASKLVTYTPAKGDDFPGWRSRDPPSMDGSSGG
ncbi:hypothetical protein CBR_g48709 [Chara braunii]|uniref:Integrase catalytic domain-containing protein n=1 Tax=Chara braunii TaxID=69332 RepID=A0A388K4H8_CHABU|nr:hypothetical protein CBR_g48709 [Chara braunii]|eukprot:GBG64960.1 hypothetical protein CBR_g48709 [Chara braunii]